MGKIVRMENVSKKQLVSSGNQALILAYATAVLSNPTDEDPKLLISSARKVRKPHAKYRVTLTLIELLRRRYIRSEDYEKLEQLVEIYESDPKKKPDEYLTRNIVAIRNLIGKQRKRNQR
jgi:hypothetical protein